MLEEQISDAQRFLRYVTPGIVFFVEALFLLWILLPDWTVGRLNVFKEDKGLGVVFATLLASGGVGFIFSIIHHSLHWWTRGAGALDYSGLIERLRKHDLIALVDAKTGHSIPNDIKVDRENAWVIMTALWHQYLTTSEYLKSANPRATALSDMIHSTGTVRVAALFAWLFALGIAVCVAELPTELGPIVRFILANVIAASLFWCLHRNWIRVTSLAQKLFEQVLHDALSKQTDKPLRTYVMLESK